VRNDRLDIVSVYQNLQAFAKLAETFHEGLGTGVEKSQDTIEDNSYMTHVDLGDTIFIFRIRLSDSEHVLEDGRC
jgi:hypothetical protein